MCFVPEEVGRKQWIAWNWNYQCLGTTVWVLGAKPRCSFHGATCPAPGSVSFHLSVIKYSHKSSLREKGLTLAHSSRKRSIIVQVLRQQELEAAGSIRSIVGKERMVNAHSGSVQDHGHGVPTKGELSHSHGYSMPTMSELSHSHGNGVPIVGGLFHSHGHGVPTVAGLSHSHGHSMPTLGEFSHNHGHGVPIVCQVSHNNGNND